jgi:hypothetical protein
MTGPPRRPPHDVVGKLITQLEPRLAPQGVGYGKRGVAKSAAPLDLTASGGLDAYLTSRIEAALTPLCALLHEHDVSFIRSLLKERLATDPNLSGLVQHLAKAAVHRLRPER